MAWTQAFPMTFPMTLPGAADAGDRAERALRWPVGAASPLWVMFGAAASAGVAWWWLTRWTQAVNVEALAEIAANQVKTVVEVVADTELQLEEAVELAFEQAEAAAEAPVEAAVAADAVVADPIVAEAAPVVVAPPAADDLTRMSGIGPKLSAALAERGVTRFAQIAAWTADDLAEVDAALSLKGRAVREAWVAQAKRLAHG